jgi:HTH-like domain
MAKALVEVYGCSVQVACQVVGLAHRTFYYQLQSAEENGLFADLDQEAVRHPTYFSRRLTHQLRRAPYRYQVNHKHIQRIMRQKDLLRPVKRRKCCPRTAHTPTRVIQIWWKAWI